MSGTARLPETISVLIPAYNCASTIDAAIQSVLNQTTSLPITVLVCDDASTDDTVCIVALLAKLDHRVKLIQNSKNSGVSHSRNHLLEYATGDWIAFLDADDIFLPEKLERSVNELHRTGADLLYHDLGYLRHDGSVKGKIEGISFPQAAVFSRKALGNIRFDTTLMVGEDTDFFRRVKGSSHCVHLNQALTGLRIQVGSLTDKNWLLKRVVEHWHAHSDGRAPAPQGAQAYMDYYAQIKPFHRYDLYRQWLGQKFGRLGAGYLFAGKRPVALWYLGLAALINPGYLVSRSVSKIGRKSSTLAIQES